MTIPDGLRYSTDHEWLAFAADESALAGVGITAFAADALGDVVFVDLPEVGTSLRAGEVCGEIESTKSVSDLVAPAAGEVVERNEALSETPELINTDPYGRGWLLRMRVAAIPSDLLDADAYRSLTEGGS
ncbi:MAG: glycine cleavage system protein [Pseudonocardiales bacterium]|jgi:glycine cleavage system H protein|uniref:glycine cleavage system protein GcvH n=1 Tax=Pseudonocardia sp. TaxID=60912 RepID=UPI002613AFCD|nr:glycine cleavage system protein GcvH [Pseudonocardia sp.]MCW2716791.1 glycine cleavage system protein [Pseudonocardia sp.]MDT7614004.1 glycine cleavage system protein [Pseudonocardiales bacterium]MDT7707900.1 glycine cleavage system protein [Pseudonocardiales bacterium]